MIEEIIALVLATSLLLGSPGPVPLSLAAMGASFGIKNSIPYYFGILSGLCIVIIASTFGLSVLLSSWPKVKLIIQIIGGLYILYIAYKIATSNGLINNSSTKTGYVDGFVLNLVNPKAYAAILALISQFQLAFEDRLIALISTGFFILLMAAIVDFIWLAMGGSLRVVFENPQQAKIMRWTFALLMVVSVFIAFTI
jgi:threonine/homoserine/homoserine lactone efflux protein